ncbi:MAG: GLUG motif-containing protein, partial [Eubacteriales bacterium]|nr:GLUG motif-containing protein [Eubacteriales bacterium]
KGGLVGYNDSGISISNSYWDSDLSKINVGSYGKYKHTWELQVLRTDDNLYSAWSPDLWEFRVGKYPRFYVIDNPEEEQICPVDAMKAGDTCVCNLEAKRYLSVSNVCACRDYCEQPKTKQDPDTCACSCPDNCGAKVQNPDTCECVCPNSCSAGESLNIDDCTCTSVCSGEDNVWNPVTSSCTTCEILNPDAPYYVNGECSECAEGTVKMDGLCKYPGDASCPGGYIKIQTAAQLAKIGTDAGYPLNGCYKLANNIDLSTDETLPETHSTAAGWIPIGLDNTNAFLGVFDGNFFEIRNLTINRPESDYQGLFGYISSGSKIMNLGIREADITGGGYVGGLLGYQNGGLVTLSYVTGTVNGASYVGGLLGYQNGGTLSRSYSVGSVSATSYAGGLVGFQSNGDITRVFSTSGITSASYAGGLVGFQSDGAILNAYSTGNVIAESDAGGLTSYQGAGLIQNVYSIGIVSAPTTKGGLLASKYGEVTASYWDMQTSGQTTSAAGVGKNTEELTGGSSTESVFTGWDTSLWCFNCDNYPVLKGLPSGAPSAATCETCLICPDDASKVGTTCNCDLETKAYIPAENICECREGVCATDGSEATDPDDCTCSSVCTEDEIWDPDLAICLSGDECPSGSTLQDGVCKFTAATGKCASGQIAIQNAGDLAKIGIDSNYPLNGSYCLTDDIDLATDTTLPSTHSTSEGWIPIGNTKYSI